MDLEASWGLTYGVAWRVEAPYDKGKHPEKG